MNELIKNKKKSEILAETINGLQYGDVLLHTSISEIIKEPYGSTRYRSTIQKAKKILLNNFGKTIESVIGDGYRVVNPDDFVDDSLRQYKRGFKAMQKGADILKKAPVNQMSEEGRERYRRVYDRAVILEASLKGESVTLRSLATKKKHPMALENVRH
jgi:hypothetical protein